MAGSHDIIIVVPCHNEARRLRAAAFERYSASHDGVVFVMVDDGSTDDTWQTIQGLACEHPTAFAPLRMPRNCGKAEAVRRGVLEGLGWEPRLFGYWDADLATPLEAIGDLQGPFREDHDIEIVLGARVRMLGHRVRREASRHYIGRFFATVASRLLDMPVYDTQCGAKLFRTTSRTASLFQKPFMSRWIFDVEVLFRFLATFARGDRERACAALYEFALKTWEDPGNSKLVMTDGLRALADLARLWSHYR